MAGIAWVLGAGFSTSLGGPMLGDLLKPELADRIRATYPQADYPKLYGQSIDAALHVYNLGRRYEQGKRGNWDAGGRNPGKALWRDPEEFLALVDEARRPSGAAQARLLEMAVRAAGLTGSPSLPESLGAPAIAAAARRLLAAECTLFVEDTPIPHSERWSTHVRWMKELVEPDDTIITFNYDVVVETASNALADKAVVLVPGVTRSAGKAMLLKLHGSVDWKKTEAGFERQSNRKFALTCEPDQIAIAGPGPSKLEFASSLEQLWNEAENALATAKAIVFVGYRFPQTDAEARRRLLGAVGRRFTGSSGYSPVHIVLGSDLHRPDSVRLRGLLQHALSAHTEVRDREFRDGNPQGLWFNLWSHPLYAEDFMSVVEHRAKLTQPFRFMPLP